MATTINNELTGQLISAVCELWGLTRADLVGKSRRRPLPWARAMLCDALMRYAGHTCDSCGAILNVAEESVVSYRKQFAYNEHTYTQFAKRAAEYNATAKKLWKQCNGGKR